MQDVRIAGIVEESITDGPGIRYVIFVQGCPHHCKGCHNPETHNFNDGKLKNVDEIIADIEKDPLIDGVTFSGGEPLCQAKNLLPIATRAKSKGLDTALYTGYTIEQLLEMDNRDIMELLEYIDVLIDGRFEIAQRTLDVKFVGSRNQRIINLPATLKSGSVILQKGNWV